jgi:hypothetical protein
MTSIRATKGPRGGSLQLRPPDGILCPSQRPPCPELSLRRVRLLALSREGCGEACVFDLSACTESAHARQLGAISDAPLRQVTRHTVPSRSDSNLLKINDWHACYPSLGKGVRPSRFLSRRRSIFQRSVQLSPLLPSFPVSISCTEAPPMAETKCRISNPVPESRRPLAASDSLSGGII